jgi:UPF0042 nucleotide-binding protein
MPGELRLIIVSGLSGSGKSVALHVLEDLGYYCIDNLPAGLLLAAVDEIRRDGSESTTSLAVGVDARNHAENLDVLPDLLHQLEAQGVETEVMFLHASDEILLKRYGESRRRHPLSEQGGQLRSAIESERATLAEIELSADLIIDTSAMSIYQLAEVIRSRVDRRQAEDLSVLIESFGFKYGIPADADFVFDMRSLPNPYWTLELRGLTGLDPEVQEFLDRHVKYVDMFDHIGAFLEHWIPHYRSTRRGYMTIAIGCTGGRHRSVYMTEKLANRLRPLHDHVLTRHNGIPEYPLIQE